MLSELKPAAVLLVLLTLITGVLYPLSVSAVAAVAFPEQAHGSLIRDGDRILGSRLIGQSFDDPRYFWGRLSATAPPCNGAASSGSNLGPINPALTDAAEARIAALAAADTDRTHFPGPIPVDLVTASGSGLDPDISPAAARYQVGRVAAARGLGFATVAELVETHIEPRWLGLFGEPRVNVLELNLALDRLR